MDQLSFASLDFAAKKKRTKRDVFLAEMAAVCRGRRSKQ
jgi:transposase, IS5 family